MDQSLLEPILRQIEAKDMSTAAHTWRVVLYARAMVEAYSRDRDLLELVTHGAALHDVGKLDIASTILQKPGKLTADEFEQIKKHPATGHARALDLGVTAEPILELVRHHHERWDGKGYPDGLQGEQIAVPARFFAVIDAFDALTSIRPYRAEIGERAAEHAIKLLEADRGTRYWPDAVDLFVELYRTGHLGWILEYFNDTVPVPAFDSTHAKRSSPLIIEP
ncbi:MAG: HD domain-containing phosphohydrolase [Planctomycetota bacterium]